MTGVGLSKYKLSESESEEEIKPLYEAHVIGETPDLKPKKRKRIVNYADLDDSESNDKPNTLDTTVSSDGDEFEPTAEKTKRERLKKEPKEKIKKKSRIKLFEKGSDDEIGSMSFPVVNNTEAGLRKLKEICKGHDDDYYEDVFASCSYDVDKAVEFLTQPSNGGNNGGTKTTNHSVASSSTSNGFTPVLAKPDKKFIAGNHKESMVKVPLDSDSEDEVQAIAPSNGRVKLPFKSSVNGAKSSYFSTKSILATTSYVDDFVRRKKEQPKKSKQKRRFIVEDDEENDNSDDSFINDSDIEEVISGDEEKPKKKKKGKKPKVKDEDEDEIMEIISDSGSDANVDEDRIILTSDDDFAEDDIDDESDDDRKKRKKGKKAKQSTLKERVFKFMSDASLLDIMSIPGVSKKKAEIMMDLRPFTDFDDLLKKVKGSKGLNPDIINSALDAIKSRDVVHKLMSDCEDLSKSISKMVQNLTEAKQPSLLNPKCTLKQYQMIGLNWLILMHQKGINAILADEMGLGKTIQVIALLAYLREHFDLKGPHCIVVPSSTMDNWDRELSLWCPKIDVVVYHGTQAERAQLRDKLISGTMNFDLILTTYNMLFSDDDKKLFKKKSFEYIIFDEAHMLKNMKTARYEKLLKIRAKHRLLLTGTPLQNNLLELMSLLIFTMPDLFSGRTEHVKNIFTFSSNSNDLKSNYEQERINHAKKIMKPFILRRLKDDVLKQLPTKTIIIKKCPMSATQEKKYLKMISKFQDEIRKDDSIIEESQFENIDDEKDDDKDAKEKRAGAAMLMTLRKAANHPLLNRVHYNHSKLTQMSKLMLKEPTHKDANPDLIYEDMEWYSDFELHQLCLKYKSLSSFKLPDSMILDSGKFEVLDTLLPQFKKEKRKVLIFSQFVIVLDIVEEYLNIRGHNFTRLDGSTKINDRLDLIDDFNSSQSELFIFLLTTKAGGVGINLTSATVAIIHDIDFNPYNDKQAEDRCHRVGQTKEVTVYKLVSEASIEEGMLAIAENKLKLGEDLCANNNSKGSLNSKKDMKTLLKQCLNI